MCFNSSSVVTSERLLRKTLLKYECIIALTSQDETVTLIIRSLAGEKRHAEYIQSRFLFDASVF